MKSTPTTTTIGTTGTASASSKNPSGDRLLTDLFEAYYNARDGCRNSFGQIAFEQDFTNNIYQLYLDIVLRQYEPGRSTCFIIYDPVKREIFAAPFRDRIIHHLLYDWLEPYFENSFIYDSYACRKGKGTLFGIERLELAIRKTSQNYTRPCFVLKLDIQGHFMSIARQLVYDTVMERLYKHGVQFEESFDTYHFLLKEIIFNDPVEDCVRRGRKSEWDGLPKSKSLFFAVPGCGLPIGNLTSQLFSNIIMDKFDQFVKRVLKVKYYGRYVDDFYLVGRTKEELVALIEPIRTFLKNELGLTLHPKKIVLTEQSHGVQFLGSILKNGRRLVSRRGLSQMHKKVDDALAEEYNPYSVRATLDSYRGHIEHVSTRKTAFPYKGLLVA